MSTASQNARKSVTPFPGRCRCWSSAARFSRSGTRWSRMQRRGGWLYSQLHLCGVWGLYIHHEPAGWRETGSSDCLGRKLSSEYRISPTCMSQTPANLLTNKNKCYLSSVSRFNCMTMQKPNAFATRKLMDNIKIIGTPVYEQKYRTT